MIKGVLNLVNYKEAKYVVKLTQLVVKKVNVIESGTVMIVDKKLKISNAKQIGLPNYVNKNAQLKMGLLVEKSIKLAAKVSQNEQIQLLQKIVKYFYKILIVEK